MALPGASCTEVVLSRPRTVPYHQHPAVLGAHLGIRGQICLGIAMKLISLRLLYRYDRM